MKIIILILTVLMICGCSSSTENSNQETSHSYTGLSNRDLETNYDASKSVMIYLNGDTVQCSSDAVRITGTTVTILDEGTYVITGSLDDGMIVVDTDKEDKTQIVLDGVSIHSETSAPVLVLQSDKVVVTLKENTVNTLSNGGSFEPIDDVNVDAVIFSKEDLTINGSGSLNVNSPAGHGIVSKDELSIAGGKLDITTSSHGLTGKDGIVIANAELKIASGKDGIHAENNDDASLGYVYIESGTFDVEAQGDGISAQTKLLIHEGTFHVVTGGGSENAAVKRSEQWGKMPFGRGPNGMGKPDQSESSDSSNDESTSIKGLKAGQDLTIMNGTFVLDCADDAVHSNANLTVQGGEFTISSGDDGFHADETLLIESGVISILTSYEGLEGLEVLVSGGQIELVSSDDGLNAAGGVDSSGFGGGRQEQFGASSNGSIVISGGLLKISSSGDGIDANGTLEISGGYITVTGPAQGDTATLDYDVSAVISGGTFIGTGSSMMAQTFSDSKQGVIAVQVGNRGPQTEITLTDEDGNVLVQDTPEMSFAVVIISTEELVKGRQYTITVGTDSGTFEAQ